MTLNMVMASQSDGASSSAKSSPQTDATEMPPQKPNLELPNDDERTIIISASVLKQAKTIQMVPPPATTLPSSIVQGVPAPDTSLLGRGTRLAEFEITGVVGQGGFGVVYKAWDHALERDVAIKEYLPASLSARQIDGSVVPLSQSSRETFDAGMRSFFNEARLLAQFDHPSLLKVYRFWQERGTTYMVMPLYQGKTLKEALAEMGSSVDEAWLLKVMDGVTQALAVMHQANCFHRDIAPDNIMLLEGTGLPVVLDFGAARRVITDMAQAITVILKPGYAPVEQYAEVPEMSQGAWTDVYALGAVMHVAVCGRPPPPSVARLLNDRYIPLSTNEILSKRYGQALLTSIDAALAVRPEHRPQTMLDLRGRLGIDRFGTASVKNLLTETPLSKLEVPVVIKKTFYRKILIGSSVLILVLGSGIWWNSSPNPNGSGKIISKTSSVDISSTTLSTTTVVTATPIAVPFDPSSALRELAKASTTGFELVATPAKAQVQIAKDKLEFSVRSNQSGYVYVYFLSTSGELYQLFPNLLDKRNQIKAGESLALPRASWPMEAGGPAGTNYFAVVVSESERDFSTTGIQYDGVFGQFPIKVIAALESARGGTGPPSLLGRPTCLSNLKCSDSFGAAEFKIVEQ